MRKLALASWVVVPAVAAVGCTSILGDFTSGDGGPTISGMDATAQDGQATQSDGGSGADGGTADGAVGEAGPDARPPLLRTCTEDMTARVNLSANPNGAGPVALTYDSVAVASLNGGNGDALIVVVESNKLHAYTFIQSSGGVVDKVFAPSLGNLSNVLDIQRYPGGFAVLLEEVNAANQPFLAIARISDGNSDVGWPGELAVSAPNFVPASTSTSGNNNLQAVLGVLNASSNDFYIAVYDNENGMDVLRAERVTSAGYPPALGIVGMYTQGTYSLPSPAFAFTPMNSYVLLQPSGNNGGPMFPNSAIYTLPPSGIGSGGNLTALMPPTGDTLYGLALANSTLTSGSANVAFIEGNLSTFDLNYYVGQVPTTGLGSLAWQNLTVTTPPRTDAGSSSIEDLPVNQNAIHYESFPQSEALLAISTTQTVTSDYGLNFIWWDALTGYQLASQTGQTRLLSDVTTPTLALHRSNVTFVEAPAVRASFRIVYELETPQGGGGNNSSGPGALWTTIVNCLPQ